MRTARYLVSLAFTAVLAACGGGDDLASLSTERIAAAQPKRAVTTVSASQAADMLMDAAEAAYPTLFPGHGVTQSWGPFAFRHYASTNMYLGVVVAQQAGYTMNGVYVVGNGFGTLAAPSYQGVVTNYLTNIVIDTGQSSGHTLVVTVSVMGVGSTITVNNVPAPTGQVDFCSGLASDTTFTQIAAQGGGTLTINSCSYSGNTGQIAATLAITGPYSYTVPYTITYTYN